MPHIGPIHEEERKGHEISIQCLQLPKCLTWSECDCKAVYSQQHISGMQGGWGGVGKHLPWCTPRPRQRVEARGGCHAVTSVERLKRPTHLWKAAWGVYGAKMSDRVLV